MMTRELKYQKKCALTAHPMWEGKERHHRCLPKVPKVGSIMQLMQLAT